MVPLRHITKQKFTCLKFLIQTPPKLRYQGVPLQKLAKVDTSEQDLCFCWFHENCNISWKWCQIEYILELDWRIASLLDKNSLFTIHFSHFSFKLAIIQTSRLGYQCLQGLLIKKLQVAWIIFNSSLILAFSVLSLKIVWKLLK